MREIIVRENEAGQRLDKLLARYLGRAPMSFLYKMLRKKNIVLNGKKAAGDERAAAGDCIRFYLSDETYEKFASQERKEAAAPPLAKESIVYENEHLLIVNKPAGVLSQKSNPDDCSINEQILSYLMREGAVTKDSLAQFRPSVCNRLDRNTSGLLLAGKTLAGARAASALLKDRSLRKYYLCPVYGEIKEARRLTGYLTKEEKSNKAHIDPQAGEKPIVTQITPLFCGSEITLLYVHLITGRSHQIRAHLASIGHPVIGDCKYGTPESLALSKKYGASCQLLHAWRMEFPPLGAPLADLSERTVTAELPEKLKQIIKECGAGDEKTLRKRCVGV